MRGSKFNRRRFLFGATVALPAAVCVDAKWIEPHWVKTRTLNLATGTPTHRIVHITDIHHKGDRAYLESVVEQINRLSPDAVCFTGDIIEEAKHLPEALEILAKIKSALYGVPGNHDYWAAVNFDQIGRVFSATGGAWLMDAQVPTYDGKLYITGVTCITRGSPAPIAPKAGSKNIMLLHYPLMAEKVEHQFDLLLAGHSHGGQVRMPFYGAFILPYWVGKYDMGLFHVPAGPLYVNPGIGWLVTPIRFNCRPEITVIEI